MPRLEIRDGSGRRVLDLPAPVATFGSSTRVTVPLRDDTLATIHFEIRTGEDGCWLADLGSGAGTRLNGRITAIERLSPGDRIEAGGSEIVFDPAPEPVAPVPATADASTVGVASAADARPGVSKVDAPRESAPRVNAGPAGPSTERKRRLRTGWIVAGFVWGALLALVAALFLAGEGLTLQVGPFVFKRGSTSQLSKDLVLVALVVLVLHAAALGIWLAATRMSARKAPPTGRRSGDDVRRSGPAPGPGPGHLPS
jgi:hypothetical protein